MAIIRKHTSPSALVAAAAAGGAAAGQLQATRQQYQFEADRELFDHKHRKQAGQRGAEIGFQASIRAIERSENAREMRRLQARADRDQQRITKQIEEAEKAGARERAEQLRAQQQQTLLAFNAQREELAARVGLAELDARVTAQANTEAAGIAQEQLRMQRAQQAEMMGQAFRPDMDQAGQLQALEQLYKQAGRPKDLAYYTARREINDKGNLSAETRAQLGMLTADERTRAGRLQLDAFKAQRAAEQALEGMDTRQQSLDDLPAGVQRFGRAAIRGQAVEVARAASDQGSRPGMGGAFTPTTGALDAMEGLRWAIASMPIGRVEELEEAMAEDRTIHESVRRQIQESIDDRQLFERAALVPQDLEMVQPAIQRAIQSAHRSAQVEGRMATHGEIVQAMAAEIDTIIAQRPELADRIDRALRDSSMMGTVDAVLIGMFEDQQGAFQ